MKFYRNVFVQFSIVSSFVIYVMSNLLKLNVVEEWLYLKDIIDFTVKRKK